MARRNTKNPAATMAEPESPRGKPAQAPAAGVIARAAELDGQDDVARPSGCTGVMVAHYGDRTGDVSRFGLKPR
jgi:hypothetical protein